MLTTRFRTAELLLFLFHYPVMLKHGPRVKTGIWLRAATSAVFPLINDLSNWPRWMASELIHREMEFEYGACRVGEDAELKWSSPQLSGSVLLISSSGGRHVEFDMETRPGSGKSGSAAEPYRVRGSFDCRSEGVETRVSWRCAWQPSVHPRLRFNDLFKLWLIKRDFARGLLALKKLVENPKAVRV